MLVVGFIASALGIAAGLAIEWFPESASTQAGPIDHLYDVLIWASVPVFVLVTTVVLFSAIKFRMRPGEENLDGPPIHGNTRLEVIWTAIPAVILVVLCAYAWIVLVDIEEAQANEMRINVTGQQFAWTFEYPQSDGKPIKSNQLYLPKDKPVRFYVKALDVIHDFWVPAFRMKVDAVPGIETRYRITPNRLGNYPVVCAELCGLGHAVMRNTARVVTPAEFDKWLAEQQAPAEAAAGSGASDEADGKTLFTDGNGTATACGACHTLADAGTASETGPNLDETLPGKDAAYIEEGIVAPDAKIAPGFQAGVMPKNYGDTLSDEELQALVKYLGEVAGK
ncbi:MAG TPA: cytochrome c oxidase subunit II [Solirubrobacteraceae bacterium]|nr:cytochrome c oxidase subunit II [Solirubrobacteraceae bacterium]